MQYVYVCVVGGCQGTCGRCVHALYSLYHKSMPCVYVVCVLLGKDQCVQTQHLKMIRNCQSIEVFGIVELMSDYRTDSRL